MPVMPPGMPPGPPTGGAGAPPMAGGGGAIAQVLQQLMQNPGAIQGLLGQLMQNPAAVQGMQNFMQGRAPTEGMPQPLPPEAMAAAMQQGGGGGGPPPPEGEPPPDAAEAMATKQIANAGNTYDGVDAPTKNDIERLMEDPTPAAIKAFDAQFGEGMAEKYLGESNPEEQGESQDEEAGEGDQGSASESQYDQ